MLLSTSPTGSAGSPWTVARLFHEFRELGPLRVISVCGPSVFETICELGPFGIADGWLNAIAPTYHWHLNVSRCSDFRTRDEIHERSGRRVLFFLLFEEGAAAPFLSIYLHREKQADFLSERLDRFAAIHTEAHQGIRLAGDR